MGVSSLGLKSSGFRVIVTTVVVLIVMTVVLLVSSLIRQLLCFDMDIRVILLTSYSSYDCNIIFKGSEGSEGYRVSCPRFHDLGFNLVWVLHFTWRG